MPGWEPPFDSVGRMHGGAMVLTLGSGGEAHNIALTKFGRKEEPQELEAKDSGDWDPDDKILYGTSINTGLTTSGTIEGFFKLSDTPDWVLKLLTAGLPFPFTFKPDGVTTLISGSIKLTNYSDDFVAEDWCTFTADWKIQGKPTRLAANISEPA